MKTFQNNIAEAVFIGMLVLGLTILIEAGLKEISFVLMVWSAALVEEGLKFAGLLVFKPSAKFYYFGVAFLFAIFESLAVYFSNTQYNPLGIRLLPHFLFAGLFLLGAKKNKGVGFLLAYAAHTLWNGVVLLT